MKLSNVPLSAFTFPSPCGVWARKDGFYRSHPDMLKVGINAVREVSVPLRGKRFETSTALMNFGTPWEEFPSPCGVRDLKPLVGKTALFRSMSVSVPLRGKRFETAFVMLGSVAPVRFRPLAG